MRCCRGVRPVRGRSRRRRRGGCFVRRVQRDHQDAPHARVRANRRGVGGVAPDGSRRRRRRLRKRLFRSAAAADAAARAGPGAAAASRPARADVRGEAGPRERRERPLRKHRGRRGPGRRRVAVAGAGARCAIGPAETGNERLRQSLVRERHCRRTGARAPRALRARPASTTPSPQTGRPPRGAQWRPTTTSYLPDTRVRIPRRSISQHVSIEHPASGNVETSTRRIRVVPRCPSSVPKTCQRYTPPRT